MCLAQLPEVVVVLVGDQDIDLVGCAHPREVGDPDLCMVHGQHHALGTCYYGRRNSHPLSRNFYFARSAEAASEVISSSEDPGRLGRSAYTYFHMPMIAGIIAVAAADELTVAHPGDRGTALFLAGHAFFKWAVFGVLPWSRAIAALAVLIPVAWRYQRSRSAAQQA
jgi:hypothetical protein